MINKYNAPTPIRGWGVSEGSQCNTMSVDDNGEWELSASLLVMLNVRTAISQCQYSPCVPPTNKCMANQLKIFTLLSSIQQQSECVPTLMLSGQEGCSSHSYCILHNSCATQHGVLGVPHTPLYLTVPYSPLYLIVSHISLHLTVPHTSLYLTVPHTS